MGGIEKKKISKKAKLLEHKENEQRGRPRDYPVPQVENLLFYIQRNYNSDAIVYQLNLNLDGLININEPIKVFWIRYSEGNKIKELNYLQKKLAYGYTSAQISQNLFEFELVSYSKRFFLAKQEDNSYKVFTSINSEQAILNNVYIHADEDGVFPDVKFIELYGNKCGESDIKYEKITLH